MSNGTRPEPAKLLERIEAHAFDPPEATQTFEHRLAKEQGWTLAFTRRAIAEYRRFAFLYASSGEPVAPSDVVDQVWHTHLLYTRNYWDVFCKQVLGRQLHHEPAAGQAGERDRLGDWYSQTLARYREHFGDPPADIWPDAQTLAQRPKPRHQWVDVAEAVVLRRRAIYAIAAAFFAAAIVTVALLIWTMKGP